MSKILCIYHGGCDDGFGAAWVLNHWFSGPNLNAHDDGIEFYPGVYQQEPPDVHDRHVIFVDFCYKRPVMDAIVASAKTVLVIDHHKTAEAELEGWQRVATIDDLDNVLKNGQKWNACLFDMERSGAGLAWDFFHPGQPRPEFINYLEDRDLWRKSLPNGDEFTIALRSYPQTFEQWNKLFVREASFSHDYEMKTSSVAVLIVEGHVIQRYYRARVDELKKSSYVAEFILPSPTAPVGVPSIEPRLFAAVVNAPYFAASEVAGEVIDDFPGAQFGASYFEVRPGQWQYSLRSRSDFDVSAIAKRYGGGGHKDAAGFTVPRPVHVEV